MTIYIMHNEVDRIHSFMEETNLVAVDETSSFTPTTGDILVQWGIGHYTSESSKAWVLNGVEGLRNCTDGQWREILPIGGVRVATRNDPFQKVFIVYVFQTHVLGIFSEQRDVWLSRSVKKKVQYREVSIDNKRIEIRKVKRIAIQSLHALGLDFGMVMVGINGKELSVLHVVPKFKLFSNVITRISKAIHTLNRTLQNKIDPSQVMLGADPEFVLRKRNGKFVLASNYFGKKGSVGCDQIWLQSDKTKTKLPIAEVRPLPNSNPLTLAHNIYLRLLYASKRISDPTIQLLAGSHPLRGYPIGGHIHFSNIAENSFLLRALDNYLALPLLIIEDPAGLSRRPKYGFLGDYREKSHGGFEYRTLPSWLVSPHVTKGVLALAKVIACSYPNLRKVPLSSFAVQKAFYDGDQARLYALVQVLWHDLESQPMYADYKTSLDSLKEDILQQKSWDETSDIRIRWGIPPYNQR